MDLNLGKYDLSRAYENAQNKVIRRVDKNYLIIFDPSEIVKPFAKKMEALHLVRDGSEKPRIIKNEKTGLRKEMPVLKPGYNLRIAIAVSTLGEVLLLALELYSAKSEFF